MNSWQLVSIAGIALLVAGAVGFLIWNRKWLWNKAEEKGEAEERATVTLEAAKIQRKMADAQTQRRSADELLARFKKKGEQ